MTNVMMFRMPFQNNKFNKNQRVWVVMMSGAMAFKCAGKFRGKNRYVKCWVRWNGTTKPFPDLQKFEVSDAFAKSHDLLSYAI